MSDYSQESRLDRIERILEQNALRQEAESHRLVSIERTVQAMLDQRVTDQFRHEERLAKYEQEITELKQISARLVNVQEGMAKMLEKIDDTQPTILKRLMAIENKLDALRDQEQ